MGKILSSLIFIIIGIVLVIISFFMVNFDYKGYSTQGNLLNKDYEFEYTNQNIIIDSNVYDIEILKSNSNKIKIELLYRSNDLITVDNNANIYIKDKINKNNFIGINFDLISFNRPKITIYIPTNYQNDLEVKGDVNKVTLDNININNININTNVGEVLLNNVNVNNDINITTNVGNININNTNSNYIRLQSDIGNIHLNNFFSKNIFLKSNIGNIKALINEKEINYTKHINNQFGDSNISSSTNGIYTLDIYTIIGNINIEFK